MIFFKHPFLMWIIGSYEFLPTLLGGWLDILEIRLSHPFGAWAEFGNMLLWKAWFITTNNNLYAELTKCIRENPSSCNAVGWYNSYNMGWKHYRIVFGFPSDISLLRIKVDACQPNWKAIIWCIKHTWDILREIHNGKKNSWASC